MRFALYGGDVNQDYTVDASDLSETENAAAGSSGGYINTDVTGDDYVDGSDLSLVENNAAAGVSTIIP